jgi:hypothetical protein
MAKISPRKLFNFTIYFPELPYEPFLVQKVNLPDSEVEIAEHSEGNHDIKTGGRVKVGNITLENIMRSTAGTESMMFWDWKNLVADPFLNGGAEPALYYKTMVVKEYGTNGVTVINEWVCTEVFPIKINGLPLDRKSSENTVENVELACNYISKF